MILKIVNLISLLASIRWASDMVLVIVKLFKVISLLISKNTKSYN